MSNFEATAQYRLDHRRPRQLIACCALLALLMSAAAAPLVAAPLKEVIGNTQPKIVKLYGAGGFRGLEAYQSGLLISADGHILTVWSYVLDTDEITAILDDGRKFSARVVGADPRLELAVLKIEAKNLDHFVLRSAADADADTGTRVLAFSNLFGVATGDEPASVLHGIVSAKTRLEARQGIFETAYRGQAFVLDAMTNNPGAAGGALTDYQGRLLGMVGKELRNALNNTWLNYAIPAGELAETTEQIIAGTFVKGLEDTDKPERAWSLAMTGIVLVPDILTRTPPYVDAVRGGSLAYGTGLQPDDLIMFINGRLVQTCKALVSELEHVDRADPLQVTAIRGSQLIEIKLTAPAEPPVP